ncbi:YidH family protein [Demequina activiva]|uniref:Membrane protein n=1 Tax=Demequina activiva TaxID=1582364 RepID=A0A919UJK7_9MICO|nr:DUF202 domain-containing protein [Demequina activiva]GIG53890.1 membrane protein [Demequina activiva]
MTDRRFPRAVYGVGEEPDPRFSMANERTFLAWVRTALALIAAGVAVEALELPVQPGLRAAAATVFAVLGLLAAAQAWLGWWRTEKAMRLHRPMPGPGLGAVIVAGVFTAALLLLIGWLV